MRLKRSLRAWSARRLLAVAFAVSLTSVAAGCGGAASPTTQSGAAGAPTHAPASARAPAPAGPGAEPTLTVAFLAHATVMAPLWMAQAVHAFRRNHVRVKVMYLSSSNAVAALVAGQVDALEMSGPPVIEVDLHTHGKTDLVLIAGALNRMVMSLYAAPDIHDAAQLKGKVIASDRPGTPVRYGTDVELSRLHLTEKDVKILPVGGGSSVYTALLSGQVQAANLVDPFTFEAKDKGYNDLVNTFHVPYQNIGIVVLRSRVKELTPALLPFLAAFREGIQAFNGQPALTKQVLKQYTKESDPAILEKTYQFYTRTLHFNPSLQPTVKGMQGILNFLAPSLPAARTAKPGQFLDTSLLAKLPPLKS